ncbi:hypothetical protein O9993_03065 [Vibrio lentus]|nr:hypothetical protein [Vibrio lentus]
MELMVTKKALSRINVDIHTNDQQAIAVDDIERTRHQLKRRAHLRLFLASFN